MHWIAIYKPCSLEVIRFKLKVIKGRAKRKRVEVVFKTEREKWGIGAQQLNIFYCLNCVVIRVCQGKKLREEATVLFAESSCLTQDSDG